MNDLIQELTAQRNPIQAKNLQRFFKTGPGQYGEGDLFLGLKVPQVRSVVKKYKNLPLKESLAAVQSEFHEIRLAGLLIWVSQFEKADQSNDEKQKEIIFKIYLKNKKHVNNWDLVDLTAPNIVGAYLWKRSHEILEKLITSKILWDRRIAVLSTFYFIRQNDFKMTLKLCVQSINDDEDLMHKACGWMLREIGKRDEKVLTDFLKKYSKKMPRTMLRYSIERLSASQKNVFMKKQV